MIQYLVRGDFFKAIIMWWGWSAGTAWLFRDDLRDRRR